MLNVMGVALGDFVHADYVSGQWQNYKKTEHTARGITTTTDNGIGYVSEWLKDLNGTHFSDRERREQAQFCRRYACVHK